MQSRREVAHFSSKPHSTVEVSLASSSHLDSYPNDSEPGMNSVSGSKAGVGFRTQSEEYQEERKKYLTAKYGSQQMKLIRKRLFVEFWIDEELKKLYDVQDDSESYDCELDLDEILDLPNDHERQEFIWNQVKTAPQPENTIMAFVSELVQKASSL